MIASTPKRCSKAQYVFSQFDVVAKEKAMIGHLFAAKYATLCYFPGLNASQQALFLVFDKTKFFSRPFSDYIQLG